MFTEFASFCYLQLAIICIIGVMDVVCSENADNRSLVMLGTKALWQPSTGCGNSNVKQMNVQTE